LGPMFQHLLMSPDVNVLAFGSNLGQTTTQKCSKLAPSFFGPDS
jgi:hypothetical protein